MTCSERITYVLRVDAYHVVSPSLTGVRGGVDVLMDVWIDDAASGGEVTLVRCGDRWVPYDMDADLLQWLRARVRDDDEDAVLDVIVAAAAAAVDETRSPRYSAGAGYDDDDDDDDDHDDHDDYDYADDHDNHDD